MKNTQAKEITIDDKEMKRICKYIIEGRNKAVKRLKHEHDKEIKEFEEETNEVKKLLGSL